MTETDRTETHWNAGYDRAACGVPDGHLTTDVEMLSCLKCLSVVIDTGVGVVDYDPDDYC